MKKQILLVPGPPLSNRLEIEVMDRPNEFADDFSRRRCKITVEYSPRDLEELKNQGMDMDAALDYYRKYIYDLVRFHIAQDWEDAGGMEETMEIIKTRLTPRF